MNDGGDVFGIIPKDLVEEEVAPEGGTELHVVDSMHDRKARMAEFADGFVALPGGLGTIEKLFEVLTWAQLGVHQKPCGLLSICGYYDQLSGFLDHAVSEQFLKEKHGGEESGSKMIVGEAVGSYGLLLLNLGCRRFHTMGGGAFYSVGRTTYLDSNLIGRGERRRDGIFLIDRSLRCLS